MSEKPTLADLKQLWDEAKREHYPQHSGFMTKLSSAVKHAERCATVAEQLVMQKIRTRQRQKNTLDGYNRKLRLDEVESFIQQLTSLVCRIPQAEAISDFVERVKEFKIEAADPSLITDTNTLSTLLDRGIKFDLQLPEIPKLKQALDKRRWTDSVDSVVAAVSSGRATRAELARMRNLLDEGVNLVAAGVDIEQSLAKLQANLVALENDESEDGPPDAASGVISGNLSSGVGGSHYVKRSGNVLPAGSSKRFRTSKQSREGAALSSSAHEDDQRCSAAKCLQPTGDEVNWVQCEGGCDQWFHIVCVDLTLQSLDSIDRYTCHKCTSSMVPLLKNEDSNSSPEGPTITEINEQQLPEASASAPVEIVG